MSQIRVGRYWSSGADDELLTDIRFKRLVPASVVQDGFFVGESGVINVDPSQSSDIQEAIEARGKHGYVWIGSREYFIYSNKKFELATPVPNVIPPSWIERVLIRETQNVPIRGYRLSDIPRFDTPIIVSAVPEEFVLDENLILSGRFNRLRDRIAETFETPALSTTNLSAYQTLSPDRYIYEPTTEILWIAGNPEKVLVEYEAATTKRFTFSRSFTPLRLGMDKGLLSLVFKKRTKHYNKVVTNQNIYRKSPFRIKVSYLDTGNYELIAKPVFTDASGNTLIYTIVDSNENYMVINTIADSLIYSRDIPVGKTDSNGVAIVPKFVRITGAQSNSLRKAVTSGEEVEFVVNPSGRLSFELEISLVRMPTEQTVSSSTVIVTLPSAITTFGQLGKAPIYFSPASNGITETVIEQDLILLDKVIAYTFDSLYNGTTIGDGHIAEATLAPVRGIKLTIQTTSQKYLVGIGTFADRKLISSDPSGEYYGVY